MELAGIWIEQIAWFAVLQGLDVIIIEGETTQIRKLRRVAEHSERQVVRELPKTIKIMSKLDVFLRHSVDIDRSEQKNLGGAARWHRLHDGSPALNCGNLLFAQANVVPEELL